MDELLFQVQAYARRVEARNALTRNELPLSQSSSTSRAKSEKKSTKETRQGPSNAQGKKKKFFFKKKGASVNEVTEDRDSDQEGSEISTESEHEMDSECSNSGTEEDPKYQEALEVFQKEWKNKQAPSKNDKPKPVTSKGKESSKSDNRNATNSKGKSNSQNDRRSK